MLLLLFPPEDFTDSISEFNLFHWFISRISLIHQSNFTDSQWKTYSCCLQRIVTANQWPFTDSGLESREIEDELCLKEYSDTALSPKFHPRCSPSFIFVKVDLEPSNNLVVSRENAIFAKWIAAEISIFQNDCDWFGWTNINPVRFSANHNFITTLKKKFSYKNRNSC